MPPFPVSTVEDEEGSSALARLYHVLAIDKRSSGSFAAPDEVRL